MEEKYFIEFYIDFVLKVEEEKKKVLLKKIQKMINKLSEEVSEYAVKMDSNVTSLSESDVAQMITEAKFSEMDETDFN
jgi:Na+/phosphate symporter